MFDVDNTYGNGVDDMSDFTHAIVDDMGDIIRKYRWNAREAKWHKEQGSNVIILVVVKEV
jgi:hypothetical protein